MKLSNSGLLGPYIVGCREGLCEGPRENTISIFFFLQENYSGLTDRKSIPQITFQEHNPQVG